MSKRSHKQGLAPGVRGHKQGLASGPRTQDPRTDSERLDWVAEYVTAIGTLKKNGAQKKVELISSDGENVLLTTRSGKTVIEAFRKCVNAAMQEIP